MTIFEIIMTILNLIAVLLILWLLYLLANIFKSGLKDGKIKWIYLRR